MTIHVLDIKDLSIVGVVHDYNSFSLTLNYSKIGDFILSIDNRLDNAKLFIKNRIVMLNGDGFNTGIITHVSVEVDEDGNEIRTVKGKTLGHLLSYRVVNNNGTNEYDFEQGSAETVIKQYVKKNAVSATDPRRNFDNLVVADDLKRGNNLRWQSKFDNLDELVEEISELESLGWTIYLNLDSNIMTFDVYKGRDLSGQVVFSTTYGNLESQAYIHDEYNHRNMAYVAGEIYDPKIELDENGEPKLDENGNPITELETIINATTGEEMIIEKPKERRIYQIGNNDVTGIDRKETFIEVNESEDEYIDIPELGRRRLEEMNELETIEAKVINNTLFTFGVDYNLGDIVSVFIEDLGVSKDLRISSVTYEMDDQRDFQIYVTFGSVLPTINDRFKDNLKVIRPYIRK